MRTWMGAGTGTRRSAGAARSLLVVAALVASAGCGPAAIGAGSVQETPSGGDERAGTARDSWEATLVDPYGPGVREARDSWEATLVGPDATDAGARDSWESTLTP
jgi:hypothetical protein